MPACVAELYLGLKRTKLGSIHKGTRQFHAWDDYERKLKNRMRHPKYKNGREPLVMPVLSKRQIQMAQHKEW